MDKDKITFLKKKWLKNNIFMIIVTVIIVAVIYVIAMIFHNLYLVLFNMQITLIQHHVHGVLAPP